MIYKGDIFKNRKFDFEKLEKYGFLKEKDFYVFEKTFFNDDFGLIVKISPDNSVDIKVIERELNETFDLFFAKNATGEFIGKIRDEVDKILSDIKNKTTSENIFKSAQAKEIIKYANKKYGTRAEYLWEKFPNNAIFRKKEKWYGAILTVKKDRFYKNEKGEVEVINIKDLPENIEKTVDDKKYFKAWHMNKKHWYTIILDNSVKSEEIFKRLDNSYNLV